MDPVGWGLILFRDSETPRFREEPYLAGAGQIYAHRTLRVPASLSGTGWAPKDPYACWGIRGK